MNPFIRILHLEDDPNDAELVRAMLEDAGLDCRVTLVDMRDAFEEALRRYAYDIIIADFRLPAYDGISALRLKQELCPDVPFIFVSGTMGEDAAIEGLTKGATDYVLKQKMSRLAPAVKRALKEARNQRERKQMVEDLQRSNDLLRAIIEAAPVAIIGLDLDGRVHSVWNPAAEKMLGWSEQEVMGRPLPTVPGEGKEEFTRFREHIRAEKTLDGVEVRRQKRNGTPIDYSIYASPLHDTEGRVTGNIAVLVDITERKRAEEKKTILNQIADIFLTTPDEAMYGGVLQVILQAMKSRYGIFGYREENGDLIIPSLTREIWDECGVSDKSVVFPSGSWGNSLWGRAIREKKPFVSNGPFHTPEGHIPIDYFLTVPIVYGSEAIGLVSVANGEKSYTEEERDMLVDITSYISPILNARLQRDRQERKRRCAEETLHKLSHAIEQSPVSIVITDTEGNIEYVNPKFTEVSEYSRSEVLGKNLGMLQSGDLPKEGYGPFRDTIASGKEWNGEFQNRKKSGGLFWERATVAPVRNADGVVTHYVAVKEDVTERKKLEQQLRQTQKLEAVGQLAGGVAHDFNNMLGVIIGHAELALEEAAPDDPLRKNLKEIMAAGLRSTEITRQLLAFARKQTVVPEVLDLNKTVAGMLNLLRRLIGENIDMTWLPCTNLWPIRVDPSQIDQILANLCVNARDAIAGVGGVTIETQNVELDDAYCAEHEGFSPGEYVMLAVSDNGSGMDRQTLSKIFEPFFTTKGTGKGTGLGLATVYGIVKQNRGFVNVYSEPQHGSTFKIYLPRHAGKTEKKKKKKRLADATSRGHETILLVEDDAAVLGLARLMLEQLGYAVLTSLTPGDAMRVAEEHSGDIELLVTDLVMPEMDGRDLAKKISTLYPEVKCLFMSGYTGNATAYRWMVEEDVNFIQKPFSKRKLAAMVREALDSKGKN